MIDFQGFRPNVGIILSNAANQVLWAKRLRQNAWQFPQGGIQRGETPEQALYRELEEELGLLPEHVTILGSTRNWLRYHLPERLIQRHRAPVCIGQKQKWFLLRLNTDEHNICLDHGAKPEFDAWRWADYWHPLQEVVFFKRDVYRRALVELEACLG